MANVWICDRCGNEIDEKEISRLDERNLCQSCKHDFVKWVEELPLLYIWIKKIPVEWIQKIPERMQERKKKRFIKRIHAMRRPS